jgi:hypothetical protein
MKIAGRITRFIIWTILISMWLVNGAADGAFISWTDMSDAEIFLLFVTTLFWSALYLKSGILWFLFIGLLFGLEWLKTIPITWHQMNEGERWWILNYQVLISVLLISWDNFRHDDLPAWLSRTDRDAKRLPRSGERILPWSDGGERSRRRENRCTPQEFIDTARRTRRGTARR